MFMTRLDAATGLTIRAKVRFRRVRHGRKQVALVVEKEEAELTAEAVPRIARLIALAIVVDEMVRSGQVESYAEIAQLAGMSRARLSQIMGLLTLAPDIQLAILGGAMVEGEHQLRAATTTVHFRRQRQLLARQLLERGQTYT